MTGVQTCALPISEIGELFDGLNAVILRRRIHEYPGHGLEVPMQQLHDWLAGEID